VTNFIKTFDAITGRKSVLKIKTLENHMINKGFVLEVGIEPTLQRNWILNPARLPIPPLEQMSEN
jgi:hypothetical protein